MIRTKVIKKYINTLPIQEVIQKSDSYVDTICFIVDNSASETDFSDYIWKLYFKTSLEEGKTMPLESHHDPESNAIEIYWTPDLQTTHSSGWLEIQLIAEKTMQENTSRWSSAIAHITVGRSL